MKKTLVLLALVLSSHLAVSLYAQNVATLALTNGERPSGELLDLNASGFWLRINGQDRSFPAADVAAVEFVVGPVSNEAQARIRAGQPFVILRSGQVVDGRLSDIGGTTPLKITVDTAGGPRDFMSSDVAQIHVNPRSRSTVFESQAQVGEAESIPAGATMVPANIVWTDSGTTVSAGQWFRFTAMGNIMLSHDMSSGPGGSPAATSQNIKYPVPGAPAGALIGRAGNSQPFLIGVNTEPIQMRGRGRLTLAVNDDQLADNSGAYYVTVTRVK